jgi:hypothetical protein
MRTSNDLGEVDSIQLSSVGEGLHDGRMVRAKVDEDITNTSLTASLIHRCQVRIDSYRILPPKGPQKRQTKPNISHFSHVSI